MGILWNQKAVGENQTSQQGEKSYHIMDVPQKRIAVKSVGSDNLSKRWASSVLF